MKALRPDEDYSPIHSIYVDQWDWEKVILAENRTLDYLKSTVNGIYKVIKETDKYKQGYGALWSTNILFGDFDNSIV